jgi:hypothetical protein
MMSHKAIYRNKKSGDLFAIETDEKGAVLFGAYEALRSPSGYLSKRSAGGADPGAVFYASENVAGAHQRA